jgi:tetratricopeptide (TPR) repeat protein
MRKLMIVSLASFGVALVVFALVRDEPAESGQPQQSRNIASTDQRIAALEQAARLQPEDPQPLVQLASTLLGLVRQGGDTRNYERADAAIAKALKRDPSSAAAYTERGILRLGRHDFQGALSDGQRARALAPGVIKPLGVLVDANIELGRYQEAERVLQRMIDLKPNLDSYARVAYLRELRGDLDGASEALTLATSAGGADSENVAFVQSLLGNLELAQGRSERALVAFRAALAKVPGYAPAQAGLARVDIAAGGLNRAIKRLRDLVAREPKQEYVVLLGELELADGQRQAGRRTLATVPAELKLLESAGENTETEKALFEADHGSVAAAVTAGRAAWANAPSVRAADALGWALTRAGRPREGLHYARHALRLGSRDASFLFHAGMSAKAAGRDDEARRWLREALAANPSFSPLHARTARRALAAIERRTPLATAAPAKDRG